MWRYKGMCSLIIVVCVLLSVGVGFLLTPQPSATATSVLQQMIGQFNDVAARLNLEAEAEAEAIFAKIIKLGGATEDNPHPVGPVTAGILRGIEDGWFTGEIADSAFAFQQALEDGRKHQVGVTVLTDTITEPLEILRVSHDVEVAQVAELSRRKLGRDDLRVTSALMQLTHAAGTDQNLVPLIIEAARHEATLGEICHALRDVWGEYREPARI